VIHRFQWIAAMAAAMFLAGPSVASAGSINIQFTDLELNNGVGTNAVSTVTFDGIAQPGTYTASAHFSSLPGEFIFSGATQLLSLEFNPQIENFASSALYLGSAVSWTVAPSLIPTGESITSIALSLSTSNLHGGSGSYAGTVTINTVTVPEPSSIMIASTAVVALSGLGVFRARRRKVS
jgi:hypothetical protein